VVLLTSLHATEAATSAKLTKTSLYRRGLAAYTNKANCHFAKSTVTIRHWQDAYEMMLRPMC